MARFLCTGDLHLGAGSDLGLEPYERLDEQERVWRWIVDTANELGATILFAGDAWERRRPTPSELLALRRPLHWLKFPLIGIAGNHDVEGFERPTGYDVFLLPEGSGRASVYSKPAITTTAGALVACLPWAPPGHLVALEAGGDRDDLNVRLAEGLVDVARGLFAQIEAERERRIANGASSPTPSILLTHWSIGGTTGSSGFPVDLMREPVLDAAALSSIGFDAIVAGHIHRPQIIPPSNHRPMFYVGSPMPLNFGEAHDHVVWLLDFADDFASEDPTRPVSGQAFQIPVPSRPLRSYDVVAREIGSSVGVDVPLDYDDAVVKVKIRATEEQARRLDVGEIKRQLVTPRELPSGHSIAARKVWAIQVEVERAEVVRGVAVDETLGDVEAMELYLEAEGYAGDGLEGLLERHVGYLARIGR